MNLDGCEWQLLGANNDKYGHAHCFRGFVVIDQSLKSASSRKLNNELQPKWGKRGLFGKLKALGRTSLTCNFP